VAPDKWELVFHGPQAAQFAHLLFDATPALRLSAFNISDLEAFDIPPVAPPSNKKNVIVIVVGLSAALVVACCFLYYFSRRRKACFCFFDDDEIDDAHLTTLCDMLALMLRYDKKERLTPAGMLRHDFFVKHAAMQAQLAASGAPGSAMSMTTSANPAPGAGRA